MAENSRELIRQGKLSANGNSAGKKSAAPVGKQKLGLDKARDGLLYVPKNYQPDKQAPFALMLHGAGGNADHGMNLLQSYADRAGIIVLAPSSRSKHSWDVISSEQFGQDVIFIDQALSMVFDTYSINANKIAIGGFSDGASYALSLGLINGSLFTHVIAFSPGFYYAPDQSGAPLIYLSHGTEDDILPINPCSRRIVPRLQNKGYSVTYKEFNGAHTIPSYISEEAVNWFLTNG